jgi:glycosyltransferase involved in cell wall biosynthesis
MKEKCPDIDTSSKNLESEPDLDSKNYYDLDINTLEKEFEKTKKQYEAEKSLNNEVFKKVIIRDNDSNSKIEDEYEKRHHHSIYESNEPLYKSYLGVIVAFVFLIFVIIIMVILISINFSKNNNIPNESKKVSNMPLEKPIYKNNILQVIGPMHNFTKKELDSLSIYDLTDQLYVDLCLQGILIEKNKNNFKATNNPKISIIKPVFNSTKYLNYSLRSIQNQNLFDIEIIVIDDASNDNGETIKLIKKFQEEDPRIRLLINESPKGLLYTICKGILNAKGKYIMEIDQDDLFSYGTLFSELYEEAELRNLDIISFLSVQEKNRYKVIKPSYEKKNIEDIFEDKESLIKLSYRRKVKHFEEDGMLWNKFVNSTIFKRAVKKLGQKNYGKYIFTHEDFILVFMIYHEAKNAAQYKRFGYFKYLHDDSISSRIKSIENKEQHCYEYLTYCDIIYELSQNETIDKNFAALDFISRYNEMKQLINSKNKEYALSVSRKFLNCEYIPLSHINKIKEIYNEILNNNE